MAGQPQQPFDPLAYDNIAKSTVGALLDRPVSGLGGALPFCGAGIYAIYYSGPFEPYVRLSGVAWEVPIYVGKAVPPGARKGIDSRSTARSQVLYARLKQHAKSVDDADNLALEDFSCRHLVVEHVWIRLAEQVLVRRFRPLWNSVIDGFGNHPPGKGRRAMRRPRWDIVHPGRSWAAELTAQETAEDILREIQAHLDAWLGEA